MKTKKGCNGHGNGWDHICHRQVTVLLLYFFFCAAADQLAVFIIGIDDVETFGKIRRGHVHCDVADRLFTGVPGAHSVSCNAGFNIGVDYQGMEYRDPGSGHEDQCPVFFGTFLTPS